MVDEYPDDDTPYVLCQACDGEGFTLERIAICCGRAVPGDPCCGCVDWDYNEHHCAFCEGKGTFPMARAQPL